VLGGTQSGQRTGRATEKPRGRNERSRKRRRGLAHPNASNKEEVEKQTLDMENERRCENSRQIC